MLSNFLLEHFKDPQNVGELGPPAFTVEVSNPACGDILRLSARFEADRLVEARYKTRGCTASIAAGSVLTGLLIGKTRQELAALNAERIDEAMGGLEPESHHAAALGADAVKSLLRASRF